MATEKEEFLEDLGEYKNYWNAIHVAVDAMAEKMVAGKVYLFIQGTTGSIIVDTANQESWDEQLVGIGGDIIGGVILNAIPLVGTSVNISMTVSGNSVGDILKSYYQDIKTDVQGQYWKYEQNVSVMVGGTMVTYDYAKVKCDSDGNYIMDNAIGSPVLEEISQLSYDSHYQKIEQIQNSSVGEDSVSIDNIDDKLIIKKTIDNENIQVIQSSQSTTVDLQQTTVIDENGNKTNLFYDENSSLLMYGETIDNPNKISFVNEDGSYEVWEKVNGEFTQSIKIDIAPTKTLDLNSITTVSGGYGAIVNVKDTSGNDIFIVPDEYGNVSVYDNNGQLDVLQASSILNVLSSDNISDFSDTQQNISYVWNKNLISENFYSTLSRNIRNYLINESPSNDYSFTQNTTDTNTNPTTIFDLASQYNVSVSQLEAQNPWLKDRTSDSLPSVFNNSSYNTINIENNTGISYNYTYDDTSDSNQSGSINEDEIVQKVSFIKSKQIRFYQANSKKVA